jgi:hypothetical protein
MPAGPVDDAAAESLMNLIRFFYASARLPITFAMLAAIGSGH